jgi:hypothetical protein
MNSSPQNARRLGPDKFPDSWSVDTEYLLRELARIRELSLLVPVTTANYASIQTVIDAMWNFEEHVRYCLRLQREGQHSFRRRAEQSQKKRTRHDPVRLKVVRGGGS